MKLLNSFLIFLLIILLNFVFVISYGDFFHNEFEKYNVYSALPDNEVDELNQKTLDYLKHSKPLPDFYTPREISHLQDVKNIFDIIDLLIIVSTLVVLMSLIVYYFKNKKFLFSIFKNGAIIVIIFSLILVSLILLNFNKSFDTFHKTFFESGTYTFDPLTEKMVVLYPENIFSDIAVKIFINSIITSIIIILTFYLIKLTKLNKFIS